MTTLEGTKGRLRDYRWDICHDLANDLTALATEIKTADALALRKQEFVFKPLHGFAGRGLLGAATVGRSRLHRLATHGERYIAQRWAPKACIQIDDTALWTDLRVWAYRGEILQVSGRASRRPDRLDLAPPGGWLPTYVRLTAST